MPTADFEGLSLDKVGKMEYLIELLNEYAKIRKNNNAEIVEWTEHTKGNLYWKYWENTWSYMVVISKEYGFIKWLVDNDRIDFEKDKYGIILYENGVQKFLKSEEEILMELSIQDNPIEFLCEILK